MINYDKIPLELKETGKFCLALKKEPYSPYGGKAQTNNPNSFASYSDCLHVMENHQEKGYQLGLGLFDNLVGIDIDHCVDENGNLSDTATDIIETVNSYTEYSPSGKGIHIYCKSPEFKYDKDIYYIKNSEIGVELYAAGMTNRYFQITGNAVNNYGLEQRDTELQCVLDKFMRKKEISTASTAPVDVDFEYPTDEEGQLALDMDAAEVVDRMRRASNWAKIEALLNGDYSDYHSQSEADMALCNHLAFYTQKNTLLMDKLFRESGLMREKWDEQRGKYTYGQETIRKAIAGCNQVWDENYRSSASEDIDTCVEFLKHNNAVDNLRYPLNDIGAGYLLFDYIRPFARYVRERKGWVVYTGSFWKNDVGNKSVEAFAKNLWLGMKRYTRTIENNERHDSYMKWVDKWQEHKKRAIYIEEATSVEPLNEADFDKDKFAFNLENGTLDLKTMVLRDHNPDDLITRQAQVNYDPSANCDRWEKFILEIMEPGTNELPPDADAKTQERIKLDKASYLQRFLGYCLSGDTSEESFLILYGPTSRNGKSVCVGTVSHILGTYARTVNADTLLFTRQRNGSSPSEDIARLAGIRMADVGEIPQQAQLDSARVKSLTGGDNITARNLHEKSFEFIPQFKLLLHTNDLPKCRDMAMFDSNRVKVLTFSRHFEEREQDKHLKQKFKEPQNTSGILNWLLEGYRQWSKYGLGCPASVSIATSSYRQDYDYVSRFIAEKTEPADPDYKESFADIKSAYLAWCNENGVSYADVGELKKRIMLSGFLVDRQRPSTGGDKATVVHGLRILPQDYNDLVNTPSQDDIGDILD